LLICFKGTEGCTNNLTKEEALAKINELKAQANPKNFAQLAKDNSTEPGANTTGGNLGWFDRAKMVKPFADAVYAQKLGTISDVVETQFGYHLIFKQEERQITEYKVSRIVFNKVSESSITGANQEWKNTELTGKNLKGASVQFNSNSSYPEVSLEFDAEGAKMFEDITGRNINKPVAIFLDNYAISTPNVNEKITGGRAIISGKFGVEEAKVLAQRLNAGALPVPIELINQSTVGATLGYNSLVASLKAGLYGFLLVALFMILYYRFPGVLSVLALSIYGILVLAIFKLWPVTLTLSGIAGFILSIGMAVDANVLIFERLKEELGDGKVLDIAVKNSFLRAWPSIRDSNFTTLITCFILAEFTTGVVKGFAVTLGLGVLVSMFTAIVISKTFLQLSSGKWLEKRLWLIHIKHKVEN
jgi:preprotein translocase subunit SecD